jgi:hypothetical protein
LIQYFRQQRRKPAIALQQLDYIGLIEGNLI